MKKYKDFGLKLLGIGAIAVMLGLNIRHALNGYGVTDSDLHVEVLAQSNSSGDSSGSSSSTIYRKFENECSITVGGQVEISFVLFGTTYTVPAGGSLTISFGRAAVDCASGGEFMCQYVSCADFWQGTGSGSGSGSY
jgi:hypothetical protein